MVSIAKTWFPSAERTLNLIALGTSFKKPIFGIFEPRSNNLDDGAYKAIVESCTTSPPHIEWFRGFRVRAYSGTDVDGNKTQI